MIHTHTHTHTEVSMSMCVQCCSKSHRLPDCPSAASPQPCRQPAPQLPVMGRQPQHILQPLTGPLNGSTQ